MTEMTLNGRIDFAVSGGDAVRGLSTERLLREELVLICDKAAALKLGDGDGPVPLAALQGLPIILPTRSGLPEHPKTQHLLTQMASLNVVAEVDSAYDLVRAVELGLALSIIGELAASRMGGHLVVRRLKPKFERELNIWQADRFPLPPSAQAIKGLMIERVVEMAVPA